MRAIIVKEPGGVDNLLLAEYKQPEPAERYLLVKVAASGVNRADILQRKGKYPPPEGASELIGLEIAGTVAKTGKNCKRWKEGDEVIGLLPGGGYAEYAVIHEDMAMPKPSQLSFEDAAGIPEAFLTAYHALVWIGKISANDKALIHAGASGVGSAATQLAKSFNAEVFVTASAAKHDFCRKNGADHTIDYKTEYFEELVRQLTNKKGVDVIVDFIGGPYFSSNINVLAADGRLALLALMGSGAPAEIDLRKMIGKRLTVTGSTLRARRIEYQIELTRDFHSYAGPLFNSGVLKPAIDSVFDWSQVAEAHTYMEENRNSGKIILRIS